MFNYNHNYIFNVLLHFFLFVYNHLFTNVAVTDLFPFANQCPRQAIRLHTDQSGTERIDSFFLSKNYFF